MDRFLAQCRKLFFQYEITLFLCVIGIYLSAQLVGSIIPPSRAQAIQMLALVPMMVMARDLIKIRKIHSWFWLSFVLMMVYSLFILLRTNGINYSQIKYYLFSDFRFWPYLVPFGVFLVGHKSLFRQIFAFSFWMAIIYIVLTAARWGVIMSNVDFAEQSIWTYSSLSGFVLLTWNYHSARRRMIALAAISIALLVSTILSRRNIMLTNLGFIAFGFAAYLFFTRGKATQRFLSIYFFMAVVIAGFGFYESNKDSTFKLFSNRMKDDSRAYVFNYYFDDMKDDMIIGRGIDGVYFCPLVTDDPTVDAVDYRELIECGYLQMILKGGFVYLILFLAVLLPAAYLGLFKSNNLLAKACAFIILLWLIDMGPYGLPCLSFRYLLVWISVGVCYTGSIRLASEASIKALLQKEQAPAL